jgi:hypothetical protein
MMRTQVSVLAGGLFWAAGALAGTDYNVTPLTQADVDLYMSIMRAAAAHNAHLTGDDKAAVDYVANLQKHPPAPMATDHMPTPAQIQQMERNATLGSRAAQLASYDEEIARQRGVEERYDGIKNEAEQAYAQASGMGADCGGDCGGTMTAAQIERGKKTDAAIKADKPLIVPHVAEIKTLKKQINGFMFPQGM